MFDYKRIKTERQAAGLSTTQLAAAAGIDERHLRRLEAGQRGTDPTFSTVEKLARALDLSVGDFVTDTVEVPA